MWNRRRVLTMAALTGAGVVLGGGLVGSRLLALPEPAPGLTALGRHDLGTVGAAIEAYFPEGQVAGSAIDLGAAIHQIDAMVAALYESERRLLLAAIRSLEEWPRLSLTSTMPFSSLPPRRRQHVLQAFETSTIAERRLLGASIRQLVAVGVFEQRMIITAVGYTPGCATIGGFT
jgi:hypothetical protein